MKLNRKKIIGWCILASIFLSLTVVTFGVVAKNKITYNSALNAEIKNAATSSGSSAVQIQTFSQFNGYSDEIMFSVQNYPRVDGSTSAHPLGVLVACKLTGTPCVWFEYGRTRRLWPVILNDVQKQQRAVHPEIHDALNRKTFHNGTHKSYVSLVSHEADMIFVARQPSEDELMLAEQKGVEFEIRPVALDAFVFLVHSDNIVKSLSLQQIRDIYSGKITNWKQVGGADQNINAYQRNRNSGSQETMIKLVMKETKMISPVEMIGLSMQGPYNFLAKDKNGIGFTFFYYNSRMSPDPRIRPCAVNNILPGSETIASREYMFVTEVYVVNLKGLAKESASMRLREWLISSQGQKVVAESGYVPVF